LERHVDRTRYRRQPRTGSAAARALAQTGSSIIVAGPNQNRTAAAGQIQRRHGRRDVLVNNAGVRPEATRASAMTFQTVLTRT